MSIICTKYMSLLNRRPLSTKCITSAFLVGLGDSLCQAIEYSKCGRGPISQSFPLTDTFFYMCKLLILSYFLM